MIFRKTNAHTGRHVAVTAGKRSIAIFPTPHHFEFPPNPTFFFPTASRIWSNRLSGKAW